MKIVKLDAKLTLSDLQDVISRHESTQGPLTHMGVVADQTVFHFDDVAPIPNAKVAFLTDGDVTGAGDALTGTIFVGGVLKPVTAVRQLDNNKIPTDEIQALPGEPASMPDMLPGLPEIGISPEPGEPAYEPKTLPGLPEAEVAAMPGEPGYEPEKLPDVPA